MNASKKPRATTILAVHKDGKVAMAGDGQITVGETVLKASAVKLRRMAEGKVLAGFAGGLADALTLFEKFEGKIKDFPDNLVRAAVELAKDWRSDKILRRLEALLIVADVKSLLVISGMGDVVEPDDGIAAIGSGAEYALAAARALVVHSKLSPRQIVEEAMKIAAAICVYTNENITIEEL